MSQGEGGGRPLCFKTVEELQGKIDAYFTWCDSRTAIKYDKEGNRMEVPYPRPYTISGMAVFLDCDRRTIVNYGHNDKYFPTISRARAKCEGWTEEQLFDGNDRGAKFSLMNNFEGWRDKQELSIDADITTDNNAADILARTSALLDEINRSKK